MSWPRYPLFALYFQPDLPGPGQSKAAEYIDKYIYANRFTHNYLVKIDPASGKVVGKLDLDLSDRLHPLTKSCTPFGTQLSRMYIPFSFYKLVF
jgi:hypothetical protein